MTPKPYMHMETFELEATKLRNCWAVHPVGSLGTCGWINGVPWTIAYVKAPTAERAIFKARTMAKALNAMH